MSPLLVAVLNALILILLLPKIQEIIYWLIFIGIHIRISKSDINDGVSQITYFIQA